MSASLELEIKSLLDELGRPSAVAERLIPYIEGSEDLLTPDVILTLSRFLLHAGLYAELIGFVSRHVKQENFKVPWPYFLEAIALSRQGFDDMLADVLLEGIDEQGQRADASRSKALDLHTPELRAERADRRLQALKQHRREKDRLIEQLATLRTQQLYEQERQLLLKLQKMYPGDADIAREAKNHKERYALEILSKHSRLSKTFSFEALPADNDVETLKAGFADVLIRAAEADPDAALDLAISAAMLELWETALDALSFAPESRARDWLHLELLLGARRFLEMLHLLAHVEQTHADDPEAFFATAYLRAQALWGLGQKEQATEVLESLLASRPQYRAGVSLLSHWRSGQ